MIPALVVASVLARAEKLIALQKGKDARDIAALDHRAEALYSEIKPLGWKAAPALGDAAEQLQRPLKLRLLATSFLGLTADPAALEPLEKILLDPDQDAGVRSMAAQSLPGIRASDASVSAVLCDAIAQKDLPPVVARETLLPLTRLGCRDHEALARWARAGGPRPTGDSLSTTLLALQALGRSRGVDSGRELLALTGYFPALGAARAGAIAALDARREELAAWLAPETLPVVSEALRSESDRPETMLALVRVARALGPDAAPALDRLASHPDAEVLAEAAEALVAFKRVEVIPRLEAVVAGALNDPRFSPKEGRPDPAALLARVEKALDALKRAR